MSVQLLFYGNAVPVSRARHALCSVEVRGYGFCRRVNSVPLTAVEFRAAAGEYPIVFVPAGDTLRPVAVLGLRKEENLLVGEGGEWLGRYIPAFVRRYPFVFSTRADDDRFTLCVDEAHAGFSRHGRGEPLFTPGGEPSPYVDRVLRFLQEYRAQFERTRAFCERLRRLEVLDPMQARFALGEAQLSLGGFLAVNREKLQALPVATLGELARDGELELLYLHLHSLRQFEALRQRLPTVAGLQQEASGGDLPARAMPAPMTVH